MQTERDIPVADRVRGHWADRIVPRSLRPYARLARLERPIGWWLLLLPCWWSSAMATTNTGNWPNLWHLVLFLVGAVAMRGAGCTYNDIVDRNLDAQVARTRSRPIPSGQVTVVQAGLFLLLLSAIGSAVLVQFNQTTILVGLSSLVPVAVYPLMKRVTYWPQLFLGVSFSWGALMGWTAVRGQLDWQPALLYVGGILWTIGYDTIYAHQDREDDALIGVRSTARLFGPRTRPMVALFYAGAVILFAAAVWSAGLGPLAYVGLAVGAAHLAWQVVKLDIDDSDNCLRLFRSNRDFGWIVFAGLIADGVWRMLV